MGDATLPQPLQYLLRKRHTSHGDPEDREC